MSLKLYPWNSIKRNLRRGKFGRWQQSSKLLQCRKARSPHSEARPTRRETRPRGLGARIPAASPGPGQVTNVAGQLDGWGH